MNPGQLQTDINLPTSPPKNQQDGKEKSNAAADKRKSTFPFPRAMAIKYLNQLRYPNNMSCSENGEMHLEREKLTDR